MKRIISCILLGIILTSCSLGARPAANTTEPTAAMETPALETEADTATPTPDTRMPAENLPTSIPNPGGHPRLWITSSDLPRLQSWATQNNPLWQDGLAQVAITAKEAMDRGDVPKRDCGTREYEEYATEMYAELFAYLSLVDPDAKARSDYAARARTLLMHVMNAAAQGPSDAENFQCNETNTYPAYRAPEFFATDSNRARWHGEAYPLVVDWIYPSLSAQDKTTIRKVFLRWSKEIVQSGYHHPEPIGLINSPDLLADQAQVRWAGNNYFTAHMRNLGMMAMALDPSDDPDGALRAYLDQATGSWLYIFDHLTRGDSVGGLLPEGVEYSPQTASYAIQFLLALHTAGQDDPAARGPQVRLQDNPFWDDMVTAYLHSISPATTLLKGEEYRGPVHLPAFYGDAQSYQLPDYINAFGALGLYDLATGNTKRLETLRWIQRETPTGGTKQLMDRVSNPNDFRDSILYFMLFDPGVANAIDPRSGIALDFFAPGMNKIFSRTSWKPDAAWFNFSLSWNLIDHQQADGNHFEFYRNGEWLTKAHIGYADIAEGIASSEFRNLPAIENNRPAEREDDDWRIDLWRRGSQWNLVASGDPKLIAHSANEEFVYAFGDATNLYNSAANNSTDVLYANRSIVWLKPDFIVVYDRLGSKTQGRFKRWWLQIPTPAKINGAQAVMQTASGQQLFVNALLPSKAVLNAVNQNEQHIEDTQASNEPMTVRLKIEAPGGPAAVNFLVALQGADAGKSPVSTSLLRSDDGAFEGAVINNLTAVLFPVQVDGPQKITFQVPASVSLSLITGLTPGAGYTVNVESASDGKRLVISPGGDQKADSGGVLIVR